MLKLFSLLFFSICFTSLFSQYKDVETIYKAIYLKTQSDFGIDQVLVNGISYENKYHTAIGHPFFLEDKFNTGKLVYRGRSYTDIEMKYDVYEHQLVINYSSENQNFWIVLPNEFISEFSIKDKNFKKYSFENMQPGFYQVLSSPETIKCLYYWRKNRNNSDHRKFYYSYEFSKDKRTSYLLIDNILSQYHSNSSFLKLFPVEIRSDIKKYISTNKIKVTKSNDKVIEELVDHCFKLKALQQ